MDETDVKVKGEWTHLYRAIDKQENTLDFMLCERRDEAAAALLNMNCLLLMCGRCWLITVRRTKYLNNIIEQDHRFIKKLTRPMQTFKALNSAAATLDGIEVAHMIWKDQFDQPEQSGSAQFAALSG